MINQTWQWSIVHDGDQSNMTMNNRVWRISFKHDDDRPCMMRINRTWHAYIIQIVQCNVLYTLYPTYTYVNEPFTTYTIVWTTLTWLQFWHLEHRHGTGDLSMGTGLNITGIIIVFSVLWCPVPSLFSLSFVLIDSTFVIPVANVIYSINYCSNLFTTLLFSIYSFLCSFVLLVITSLVLLLIILDFLSSHAHLPDFSPLLFILLIFLSTHDWFSLISCSLAWFLCPIILIILFYGPLMLIIPIFCPLMLLILIFCPLMLIILIFSPLIVIILIFSLFFT